MTTFTVDLEPIGRRMDVDAALTLLEACQKAGVDLVAACGGVGICGTCKLRLVAGALTPLTETEREHLTPAEIAQGFRLACQAQPLSDLRVDIPRESLPAAQQMQIDGREGELHLQPAVIPFDLALDPPHIEDLRSDQVRAQTAVQTAGYPPLSADLSAWAQLTTTLRGSGWQARLALRPSMHETELVSSLPAGSALLGYAVDLGSTKLAAYLVDLRTGGTLARGGIMNPQIAYGEDVVSRIAFANRSEENRRLLQTRLVDSANALLADLLAQAGAAPAQVVDAVVVGNTAMHHFFCGLPVAQLGAAPYVASVSQPLDIRAAEVGLNLAPGARVHLPANIAGYVGGDHTAALLTTLGYAPGRTLVLVDIGTNTEISLVRDGAIYTCSTASGPAFEGAHIKDGMRAAPGAIEAVHIRADGGVSVGTIGRLAPVGICGSGILQGIAQMVDAGVIDARGVLDRAHPRVRADRHNRAEFLLVPAQQTGHGRDIVITRRDVNEIQLAKGAIRAGIEVLLRKAGITAEAVDDWLIAGAFGTYLDLASALRVGMFPNPARGGFENRPTTTPAIPGRAGFNPADSQPAVPQFHQVGNAAGVGARQMLLSTRQRQRASGLIERVHYVELTIEPTFEPLFVDAMYF